MTIREKATAWLKGQINNNTRITVENKDSNDPVIKIFWKDLKNLILEAYVNGAEEND